MAIDIVELGSALSSPTRTKMLAALGANRTISELADIANIGLSSASYHVSKLAGAGLVVVHAYGTRRIVSLRAKEIRLRVGA